MTVASALTRSLLRMTLGRWIGKKDFLFCGNYDAAVVYFLVSSCKAMGVDLLEWMEDVLLRVPGNENNRDVLRGLLPGRGVK